MYEQSFTLFCYLDKSNDRWKFEVMLSWILKLKRKSKTDYRENSTILFSKCFDVFFSSDLHLLFSAQPFKAQKSQQSAFFLSLGTCAWRKSVLIRLLPPLNAVKKKSTISPIIAQEQDQVRIPILNGDLRSCKKAENLFMHNEFVCFLSQQL